MLLYDFLPHLKWMENTTLKEIRDISHVMHYIYL